MRAPVTVPSGSECPLGDNQQDRLQGLHKCSETSSHCGDPSRWDGLVPGVQFPRLVSIAAKFEAPVVQGSEVRHPSVLKRQKFSRKLSKVTSYHEAPEGESTCTRQFRVGAFPSCFFSF